MNLAISATNPCHMFPTARAAAGCGARVVYYSGYPRWKLGPAGGVDVRSHPWRTQAVYGLLALGQFGVRVPTKGLFRWQDRGFDRWVGRVLEAADFVHAMPGQALETFRAARRLGVRTALNHATGPVSEWVKIMAPEYRRAGLRLEDHCPYDAAYFRREEEEYRLADFHCAASSVVREQLAGLGIDRETIWTVPYGADPELFFPPEGGRDPGRFRVVFAGQAGLRKGIRTLLEAVFGGGGRGWELELCGGVLPEADRDLAPYRGRAGLILSGHLPAGELAGRFRAGSVLALPSLEEGFGLVVPQALSAGLPCVVSDRVGAKDLIRHRENGSVVPAGDSAALREELEWWSARPRGCPPEPHPWSETGRRLLAASAGAMGGGARP